MLTYYLDMEPRSTWLRTTPPPATLALPFYASEAGTFYGRQLFSTMRTRKDSYILFYTLSGAGMLEQGTQQLILIEGTAVLMDCRTPQSYCTAPGYTHWHHHWVHLDGAGVAALFAHINPGALRLCRPNAVVFQESMQTVLAHICTDGMQAAIETSLQLHTLIACLATEQATSAGDDLHQQAMLQSAAYLRKRYADKVDFDALYQRAHLSKYYFIRLFKQYLGTTPYNYLLCYRITQAKELLAATQLSVQQIAVQVGFGDESNFSVQFSRLAGQSPVQYRKNIARPRP